MLEQIEYIRVRKGRGLMNFFEFSAGVCEQGATLLYYRSERIVATAGSKNQERISVAKFSFVELGSIPRP